MAKIPINAYFLPESVVWQIKMCFTAKCVLPQVLAHIMQIKDGCDAKILMNNKNDVFRCFMCESNDLLRANKNRNI